MAKITASNSTMIVGLDSYQGPRSKELFRCYLMARKLKYSGKILWTVVDVG